MDNDLSRLHKLVMRLSLERGLLECHHEIGGKRERLPACEACWFAARRKLLSV